VCQMEQIETGAVKAEWILVFIQAGIIETEVGLSTEEYALFEGWSIQLNARNLYRKNGNDDIPVTINPDGRVALIRIPNEQQFFLSNTFRF